MLPLVLHRQARLELFVLLLFKNHLMHVHNAFFGYSNLILERIKLALLKSNRLVLASLLLVEL